MAAAEAGYREAAAAGDADAAFQLGLILNDRGDHEHAAEAYQQAAAAGDMEALLNLANLLDWHLDQPEEARRLYELAVDRGDRRGMFELAQFLWSTDDLPGAATAFQTLADAGEPRGHLELGFLLAEGEREETRGKALAALRMAADLGVEDAWMHIGWQLARLGCVDEAEEPLRRAYDAGDLASAHVLHDVLEALGRPQEADAVLDEASNRAKRDVSLEYRDLLADYDGEGLRLEKLDQWVSEECDGRTPRELDALLFDATRIAAAVTRLMLAIEYGDESAVDKLRKLYEKTGRHRDAEALERGQEPHS